MPLIPAGGVASLVASIESAGKASAGPWSRSCRRQRRPGLAAGVFGVAAALALALRNMLVSTSFAHSTAGVTRPDDLAAAAAIMGPYYPHSAICPLATLVAKGSQACQ